MRLINKITKKFHYKKKNNLLLVGCKKTKQKIVIFSLSKAQHWLYRQHGEENLQHNSFIFPFYFFTLHQRTLKCYKEMCLILHGKKRKRTTSISTDSGYRLVAQLNRKRTATERNSTLSLEKTKDLCKALMPIFSKKKKKKIIYLTTIRDQNKENKK